MYFLHQYFSSILFCLLMGHHLGQAGMLCYICSPVDHHRDHHCDHHHHHCHHLGQAGMMCYICSPILIGIVLSPLMAWANEKWALIFLWYFFTYNAFWLPSVSSHYQATIYMSALLPLIRHTFYVIELQIQIQIQNWQVGEGKSEEKSWIHWSPTFIHWSWARPSWLPGCHQVYS